MSRVILVTLFACATVLSCISSAATTGPANVGERAAAPLSPEIKVRILKLASSFEVSGIALRFSGSQKAAQQYLSALPVKKTAVVAYRDGAWIISNNDKTLSIYGSKLEIFGETLNVGRARVPSVGLFVARERTGKSAGVDYVARLPIEDYLVDVVASEMPFQWPIEAQKAQAVAARSYALSIMHERRGEKFDIDSSTLHQVYQYGRSALHGSRFLSKIREAVSSTRDIVLADSSGRLLKSYFHSHCGGETEEPKEVWGVGPAFGVVNDSGCAMSPAGRWKTRIAFSEIIHRLARNQRAAPLTVRGVEMKYKLGSERVQQVLFVGLEGRVMMKAQDFREMFGYDRVKSTLFVARVDGDTLVLEGRGYGHGVGMCQTGARLMAMGGAGYEQVLRRYYPLAQIVRPLVAPVAGSIVASESTLVHRVSVADVRADIQQIRSGERVSLVGANNQADASATSILK